MLRENNKQIATLTVATTMIKKEAIEKDLLKLLNTVFTSASTITVSGSSIRLVRRRRERESVCVCVCVCGWVGVGE